MNNIIKSIELDNEFKYPSIYKELLKDGMLDYKTEIANENLTLYNINTDEIVLFAPDHCFNYVTCYEQCPEYTFYRINGCNNFVEWVEEIADQRLIEI